MAQFEMRPTSFTDHQIGWDRLLVTATPACGHCQPRIFWVIHHHVKTNLFLVRDSSPTGGI